MFLLDVLLHASLAVSSEQIISILSWIVSRDFIPPPTKPPQLGQLVPLYISFMEVLDDDWDSVQVVSFSCSWNKNKPVGEGECQVDLNSFTSNPIILLGEAI